jgi:hypothetical protein
MTHCSSRWRSQHFSLLIPSFPGCISKSQEPTVSFQTGIRHLHSVTHIYLNTFKLLATIHQSSSLRTMEIQQNVVCHLWTDPKQLGTIPNILHQRSQLGFMHKFVIVSPGQPKKSSRLLACRSGDQQEHQAVRNYTFPTLSSSIRRERRFQHCPSQYDSYIKKYWISMI